MKVKSKLKNKVVHMNVTQLTKKLHYIY